MAKDPELLVKRKAEMEEANRLVLERTNRRWVAKQLGVSYGFFNMLSYGHAAITPRFKERIATFLGTTVDELFPSGMARV